MRVPWPSVSSVGGQRCDFGFTKPDDLAVAPRTELLGASIEGRHAFVQVFPGESLSEGASGASKLTAAGAGDPSRVDWLTYVNITDPEARYGGFLEIVYRVQNTEPGLKPIDVLLPTFPVAVTRLEVEMTDIAGM